MIKHLKARSRQVLRRIVRNMGGAVAVEFSLASVLLLTLLAAAVDLSMAARASMKVGNAARAAQVYAAINGWSSGPISTAAQTATDLSVTATPSKYCGCATSTGITAAICGSTCPSGRPAGTYVRTDVSGTYSPVFWAFSNNMSMSASTITRID